MKTLITAIIFLVIAITSIANAASTNVTLAWDKVPDATGYRVYQSTISGTYNKATGKVCDTSALTCTISNLADGKYYWVATAYDAAGNESDYSNEVTYTADTTPPTKPGNLSITLAVRVTVNP